MPLRIIFMGTPEFSVPTLRAISDAGHEIVAVYSQPPRRSGRGQEQQKTPVHQLAETVGVETLTPVSLKDDEAQQQFANFNADLAIVVAYGLLLPQAILDAPRFGCINGHASLLPRWRGAAPIQRAIEAGDTQTGTMIMQMEKGLDTGPVMMTRKLAIGENTTAGQLHDELSHLTATAMVEAIEKIEKDDAVFVPQSEDGVTYARKIEKSETRIKWDQPANQVHDHIRAMSPFPGAWCEIELGGKPVRVKMLETEIIAISNTDAIAGTIMDDRMTIACGANAVRPIHLQRAGKQAQELDEFLRGNMVAKDLVLD